jgi:hypothetical protein
LDNDQALVAVLADGSQHLVARECTTTIPGTGSVVQRFTQNFISTTGDVVFQGFLKSGGVFVCRWSAAGGLELVVNQGANLSTFVAVADMPPALTTSKIGRITRVTVSPAGNIAVLAEGDAGDSVNYVLRDMAGGTGTEVMEYVGREVWYRNETRPVLRLSIYEISASTGGTGGMGCGINDAGQISITLSLGNLDHVIRVYDDNAITLLSRY